MPLQAGRPRDNHLGALQGNLGHRGQRRVPGLGLAHSPMLPKIDPQLTLQSVLGISDLVSFRDIRKDDGKLQSALENDWGIVG